MKKSVLISINPKWCELIASGKKTVEVRKTKPKFDTPFKVYIYCTQGKPTLGRCLRDNSLKATPETDFDNYNRDTLFRANGKVIGEFVCNKIEDFKPVAKDSCIYYISENEISRTGLTQDEILDYADGKVMCHWHISNLVTYDKPKDLDCFRKPIDCHRGRDCENCKGCWDCEITRPPQSWCYVEEVE